MFGEGFPTNPPVFLSKPSPPTALVESLGYGSGIHHLQPKAPNHQVGPWGLTGIRPLSPVSSRTRPPSWTILGGTVEGGNGEGTMHEMANDHQEMCCVRGGDDGSIGHSLGKKNGASNKKSTKNQKKGDVIKGQRTAEEDSGIHHLRPNSSSGFLGAYRNLATVTGFQPEVAAFFDDFGDNDMVGSCLSEGGTVEGGNGEGTKHERPNDNQEMCCVRGGDDGSIDHSLAKKNGASNKKSNQYLEEGEQKEDQPVSSSHKTVWPAPEKFFGSVPVANNGRAGPTPVPVAVEAPPALTYRCSVCDKAFPSYQVLGSHKATHKKTTDSGDQLAERTKVAKIHQCSVCFNQFPTSQALGGHHQHQQLSRASITY
ncbi:Zinc finger protein [Nymphaea thermarum]|nr:Zinc finger protein [Nymphaea thermarum]